MKLRNLVLLLLFACSAAFSQTNTFNTLDKALFPTTYGTSTYCWISNGAGVVPTWQVCPGGGFAPAGSTGQLQYNAGSSTFGAVTTPSGDCTITVPAGVFTCTKTNNVAFGTAATVNTGTSGATIPLLNGNNTFSGTTAINPPAVAAGSNGSTFACTSTATSQADANCNHRTYVVTNATDSSTTFRGDYVELQLNGSSLNNGNGHAIARDANIALTQNVTVTTAIASESQSNITAGTVTGLALNEASFKVLSAGATVGTGVGYNCDLVGALTVGTFSNVKCFDAYINGNPTSLITNWFAYNGQDVSSTTQATNAGNFRCQMTAATLHRCIYDDGGAISQLKGILRLGGTFLDASVVAGQLDIGGSSSGLVSIKAGAAAAGTYNYNLPVTAGSAGQYLTSQGGSTTAMTWTAAQFPVTFQPGLITAVGANKGGFYKFVNAATVDNMIVSASAFTCSVNPAITFYECGVSTTCASPTTIASATITAVGTAVSATINSSAITAGDYVAWNLSAGTCTVLDISGTAMVH